MSQPIGDTSPSRPDIRKAECSQCGGIRNCDIRGEHTESYGDDQFQAWTTWRILQCRGCEHVFVQTVSTNSEDYDHDYDVDGSTITTLNERLEYWPALSKRKMPDWLEKGLEVESTGRLSSSLLELYGALDNDLNRLAGIGIRMSFDIASELLGIEPEQPFKDKLDELVSKGLIGMVDKNRLEVLVDAGGASAHRGWHPKTEDLSSMRDILETVWAGRTIPRISRQRP